MSPQWTKRGGRVLVLWRAVREVEPLLKGYIRLARAESALAASSVRAIGFFAALTLVGVIVALISLVGATFAWIVHSGLSIGQALLCLLVPSLLIASIGLFGVARRFEYFTFPQTRKRVRMLAELIDEDR